jgi:hypothetical protein
MADFVCDFQEWKSKNLQYKDWYLDTYPYLKEFPFPLPKDELAEFYRLDMLVRNLEPLAEFSGCYEFLFSYFLENFPRQNDSTRFRGKTFFEMTVENLPEVIEDSPPFQFFEGVGNVTQGIADFTNLFGTITKKLYFIVIPVGIYLAYRIFIKKG